MTAARAVLMVALASVLGAASAAPAGYFGYLSGAAQNPPNGSGATGFALVRVDETAHTLSVDATFSGLSAADFAAHIHCCSTDPANAGVATTVPTFTGFPSGTAGTYANTFSTMDVSTFNTSFINLNGSLAAAETALFAGIAGGQAYFDIHTTNFPGGEIRSFLHPDNIFDNGMESP